MKIAFKPNRIRDMFCSKLSTIWIGDECFAEFKAELGSEFIFTPWILIARRRRDNA